MKNLRPLKHRVPKLTNSVIRRKTSDIYFFLFSVFLNFSALLLCISDRYFSMQFRSQDLHILTRFIISNLHVMPL